MRVLAAMLFVSVAGCATAPSSSTPTQPSREAVEAKLEKKLEVDPNRALCDRITQKFNAGDRDALVADFDSASFAERVFSWQTLPADVVTSVRDNADTFANFKRFHFGDRVKFLCLGTREFLGEPHVVLRNWEPSRFDYALFHLNADGKIDDYMVASSGFYHSELQNVGFDPSVRADMDAVGTLLKMSFDQQFPQIIAKYKALSPRMQSHPVAFLHYINAAYFSQNPGDADYDAAFQQMETILAGRTYAQIYWRLADARRRQDAQVEAAQRALLVERLDDYELVY